MGKMSALLLDTHALIWFAAGDSNRMPDAVADLIASPHQEVFVSAASIWEIATKVRLGKMPAAADLAARPRHYMATLGMSGLDISPDHAQRAGSYEVDHRDPFDRMLAAQSELEGAPLVSVDAALDDFGIDRLWPK